MKGDIWEHYKHIMDARGNFPNVVHRDTNDWEIAPIGGLAGGAGLGAGSMFFGFRSQSLGVYLKLVFVGMGAALGYMGGWNDPIDQEADCSIADWQPLGVSIPEPFSASNLCRAHGRLTVYSLCGPAWAGGWGYTGMTLTAIYSGSQRSGYLFDKFEYNGLGFGLPDVGMGVLWGQWVLTSIPRDLNNNWTKPVCKS